MKDFLKGILLLALGIFAINALPWGNDRWWNFIDYGRVSERKADSLGRDVKLVFPTTMTVKENDSTSRKVNLKAGQTVRIIAASQPYLTPRYRTVDYLPDNEWVVKASDGTTGTAVVPEMIVGNEAYWRDGNGQKDTGKVVAIQKVSKAPTFKGKYYEESSAYNYLYTLSDGQKIPFERLWWKTMKLPVYNQRIVSKDVNVENAGDLTWTFVGRREGYYKLNPYGFSSRNFKKWAARGLSGMIDGVLILLLGMFLPTLMHKTVFYMKGPNFFIKFLSVLDSLAILWAWGIFIGGVSVNSLGIFVMSIYIFVTIPMEVDMYRCKLCGAVDTIVGIDGTPLRRSGWMGKWQDSSRKVGYKQYSSGRKEDIMQKGKSRERYTTETWGEAYHCSRCGGSYEYHRSHTYSTGSDYRATESVNDAMDRARRDS